MMFIEGKRERQLYQLPSISVVIPAYNEEKNIDSVLFETIKELDALKLPYEVIVVDDGSHDKTRLLAEKHKVTVLSNGNNYGKGRALRRGFKDIHGQIVITMDADGSHKPREIGRLVAPLMNGADVVMGSRFINRSQRDSTKKLHILGNKSFNLLIRILTGQIITDSQTGFRAFKRKVLEGIEITCDGYDVETELTMKSVRNGFVVQEESVTCEKRKNGCSHVNPVKDGLKILKTIIKAYLQA